MRAWWIVFATGCWAPPARRAAPAPPPAPAAVRTCVIREHFEEHRQPMKRVALAIDGAVFARPDPVEQLALRVRGHGPAAAHVETSATVLEGELDLMYFDMRPRDPAPRDGWLEIDAGRVRGAKGASAQISVLLPDGLEPRTAEVDVPCSELTSLAAEISDDEPEGEPVALASGARLLRTPGGALVARVVDAERSARVLDRSGAMVQVRIAGDRASVVAWVSASAVDKPVMTGGFGFGRIGTSPVPAGPIRTVACSHDLPIHVRSPTRGEVRVGHLRPGHPLVVIAKHSTPDATAVDLGGTLTAYVKAGDLASCAP